MKRLVALVIVVSLALLSVTAFGAARSSQAADPIQWCGGIYERCHESGYCIQTNEVVSDCRDCPGNSCQW